MANPSKAKGTAAETAVVKYLRANGFAHAERLALSGASDKGDIRVCPGVIAEVKAHANTEGQLMAVTDGLLIDWMHQTTAEKRNANADVAMLIVKRKQKQVGDWWCWRNYPTYGWRCTWLSSALIELRLKGWGTAL